MLGRAAFRALHEATDGIAILPTSLDVIDDVGFAVLRTLAHKVVMTSSSSPTCIHLPAPVNVGARQIESNRIESSADTFAP